jgi:hypothetical protein
MDPQGGDVSMVVRGVSRLWPVSSRVRAAFAWVGLAAATLGTCVAGLGLAAAPAAAAGPEAPVLSLSGRSAQGADVNAEFFPGSEGEKGGVVFFVNRSASECLGGIDSNEFAVSGKGSLKFAIADYDGNLHTGGTYIEPGTQYTACASLTTAAGTTLSAPLTFTTAVAPEAPRAVNAQPVEARSATLRGVLNPLNANPLEPGSYHFLYRPSTSGECKGAGEIDTPATGAAGAKEEAVSSQVSGLYPDTRYAFCVVAENEAANETKPAPEAAVSGSVSFTTPDAGPTLEETGVADVTASSATLLGTVHPDGLATSYVLEYAAAGGSFVPVPGSEGAGSVPEGIEGKVGVPVSAHVQGLQADTVYELRVTATNSLETAVGEPASFVTQPAGGAFQLPDGRQWELVSPPDKRGAMLFPILEEQGLVQASVNGNAITYLASTPTEAEPPGYSDKEQVLSARGPDGWVSRGISIPHEHVAPPSVGQGEEYMAFSEDLSLGVVQPHGSFEPSLSPEASEQTPYLHTLYVDGDPSDPCVESCYRPLVTGKLGYANVPPGTRFGGCPTENGEVCGPTFVAATPDLSRVLLDSPVPLVAGGGHDGEAFPYEWAGGRLSAGDHLPELRVSTSEDGSWQYFMSESVLASGAVAGQPNMYVSHGGGTSLIAVLSGADAQDWAPSLQQRTSRVSPDGHWFAFMSRRELTGEDTHDAVTGQPDEEVYLYHAPEDLAGEAGTLVCASCDPTGGRPVGIEASRLEGFEAGVVLGASYWPGNQGIAANVPGWTDSSLTEKAKYQPRYLSDSGRLFFNSSDALVPQDVNGNEDVYEYEPPGVGGCTPEARFYSGRSRGCVDLVSSGQAAEESGFLDASGSGADVFFLTTGKLSPEDYDSARDVYDAHECSVAAPCFPVAPVAPPPCDTGDSCKPAPTPQPAIYGEPSSETFSGAGNVAPSAPVSGVKAKSLSRPKKLARALRACRGKSRRRVCEREARARFARRASRAAGQGRG